ncbi:MAG: hypothetical protein AMXMBFR84_25900 [Candidatus Hydrogenedentota bacterium]
MSDEIVRQRPKMVGPGFEGVSGIADQAVADHVASLQAGIEELWQELAGIKSGTDAEETDAYDDTSLRKRIEELERKARKLQKEIDLLKAKFPIHRYVRILSDEGTHYLCKFYNPVTEEDGSEVVVAKTPDARISDPDVMTVHRSRTELVVGDLPVNWEQSGSGFEIPQYQTGEVFPEIPGRPFLIATPEGLWFGDQYRAVWRACSDFVTKTGEVGSAV